MKREKLILFSGEIHLFRVVILSKSRVLVHFLKNALVHLWFRVCIRDKYKNKRQKQNIKHILAILHLLEGKILKDHSNKASNTTNLSFRILIILFIWLIKTINYNVCCFWNLLKALDKFPVPHSKYKPLQLDQVGLIGTKAWNEN